jgi:hypothetical protein
MQWWETEVNDLHEQLLQARRANLAVGAKLEASLACSAAIAKKGRTYWKAARALDQEKKKLLDRAKRAERELEQARLRVCELEAELADRDNPIEWMAEQAEIYRRRQSDAPAAEA